GRPVGSATEAARDDHGAITQSSWTSFRLRVANKKVQVKDCLRGPLEARVIGKHGDPIHRLRVGRDDALSLLGCAGRVASRQDFDRVLQACAVALDRGRRNRGFGRSKPAQRTSPWLGGAAKVLRQVPAQYV